MSNPDEIRADIERTRAELGQDVDALADKVTPSKIAERQTRKVRRALTSVKDRVMGVASDIGDTAHDAVENAAKRMRFKKFRSAHDDGLIRLDADLVWACIENSGRRKVQQRIGRKCQWRISNRRRWNRHIHNNRQNDVGNRRAQINHSE